MTLGVLEMAVLTEANGRVEPATYTRRDLADLLGVSERHVDRMTAAGEIPGVFRSGRLVRFRRPVVDRWLSDEGGELK
jgi:excisionase family DNA binding protein